MIGHLFAVRKLQGVVFSQRELVNSSTPCCRNELKTTIIKDRQSQSFKEQAIKRDVRMNDEMTLELDGEKFKLLKTTRILIKSWFSIQKVTLFYWITRFFVPFDHFLRKSSFNCANCNAGTTGTSSIVHPGRVGLKCPASISVGSLRFYRLFAARIDSTSLIFSRMCHRNRNESSENG